MKKETNKLKDVWEISKKTAIQNTLIPTIQFDKIINSLASLGPFYYYVVDFFDMSLSHVSSSITDIHGFDPETVTFDDVINSIHPEDMDFVAKAEQTNLEFLYGIIGKDNVVNYKSSYCFRSRMKDGTYQMLNHQAIVLTIDGNGGVGKALNIHTNIDHITKINNFTVSLIGINGNPSYFDIKTNYNKHEYILFSNREIEIVKLIAEGHNTSQISKNLHISENTVKTHRKNINKKSGCKNATALINKCSSIGLI